MEVKVDEFTVGTTVFLNFKPTAGGRVNVNFSSDRSGEILLHFNARYDQRCLVLNTRRAEGGWEQEERPPGFPIETDKDVQVIIVAESDGFLINYDGQRFCYKFRHRMPMENIRTIATNNGFAKVGYKMTDCLPGKKIYIQGDAPPTGRFAIDLYNNDAWEISKRGQPGVSRGIHINPRFDVHPQAIIRNSHSGGSWGHEEKHGGMPIRPGERFTACVTFQSNSFEIAFNGWHFTTFNYRIGLTPATTVILSGVPRINRMKYV